MGHSLQENSRNLSRTVGRLLGGGLSRALPGALLVVCCLALAAQQVKEKIEYCGLGSSHECNCLRRTQAVHQKFIENCERTSLRADGSKDDTAFDKCMSRMPAHCDIADHYSIWNSETGAWETDAVMSEHCTLACKKHDCKCDDGPTCHYGHQRSDHDPKAQ